MTILAPSRAIPPASYWRDRKSTRLNSSHQIISYAVFCLKKNKFAKNIAQSGTDGSTVRLSSVLMQPIAAEDVYAARADALFAEPLNALLDVARPSPTTHD